MAEMFDIQSALTGKVLVKGLSTVAAGKVCAVIVGAIEPVYLPLTAMLSTRQLPEVLL